MKAHYNLLLIFFVSTIFLTSIHAQNTTLLSSSSEISNDIDRTSLDKWFYLKDNAFYDKGELFSTKKNKVGLSSNDQMNIYDERKTINDLEITKYQQFHHGIKVENAIMHEYVQYCRVKYFKGNIVENINNSHTPSYPFTSAVQNALDELDADEYAWENQSWESAIKEEENDPNATYFPTEQLEWTQVIAENFAPTNYKLAYKIQIIALTPYDNTTVYVDAATGEVIKTKSSLVHNGTADVLFEGNQDIDTEWRGGFFTDWILRALDNGKEITTKEKPEPASSWFWTSQIDNEEEDWGTNDQRSTTAHRGVTQSWDYFQSRHNWNGMDNDGAAIRVETESAAIGQFDPNGQNGNFNYTLRFGNIIENRDESYAGVVDVCGHEFAHGVVFNAAGDMSAVFGEPGALNESIADIFGVLVESFATGDPVDWFIGDNIDEGTVARFGQRSLSDPSSIELPFIDWPGTDDDRVQSGLPDTYEGPRWYDGEADNNGVHINNGVHNYWFYLLVHGGTHNGTDVNGIGLIDAEDVLFFNLVANFDINTDYEDIREGYINAAREIWGICSSQEESITDAWAACGVGDPFDFCVGIRGRDLICIDMGHLPTSFTTNDAPGTTFTWDYPTNWQATESGINNEVLTLNSVSQNSSSQDAIITVTSSNGSSATKIVRVRNCMIGDGEGECIKIHMREAQQYSEIELDLYPNPVIDELNIIFRSELKSPITYEVYNIAGERVLTGIIGNKVMNVSTSNLTSGLYKIRVISKEGAAIKSFVKI